MLKDLLTDEKSQDVTLVSDDKKKFKAHRIVLEACSPVFASILDGHTKAEGNAVVYLRGILSDDLNSILQFMYLGEASLKNERMTEFLNVAMNLQVKDLCNRGQEREHVTVVPDKVEEPLDNSNSDINGDVNIEMVDNDCNDQLLKIEDMQDQTTFKYQNLKTDHFLIDDKEKVRSKDYHIVMYHDKFKCPMCDSLFTQKSAVLGHIKAKHEGVRWPCDRCDYVATQKAGLKRHVLSKHFGKRWPCDRCNFQAKDPDNLKRHLRSKIKHPELHQS